MDVLITGTTEGGIGFETAKELLRKGHRVFIVNRTAQKTSDVVNALKQYGKVEKAADELELEDLASVKEFVSKFKHPSINILINNAGIMGVPEGKTKQGLERHVGVNFVAHYLLTRLLIGKLLEGARRTGMTSRIINVSSDAHLWAAKGVKVKDGMVGVQPYDQQQQYAFSKLYQLWDTADINEKFASSSANPSIIAFVVHPGVVSTNLSRQMKPEALESLKDMGKSDPKWKFLTPAQGAETTLLCATASFADLKCSPPLKTRDQQMPYFRDVARAPKLAKVATEPGKVEETVIETESFLKKRSFL